MGPFLPEALERAQELHTSSGTGDPKQDPSAGGQIEADDPSSDEHVTYDADYSSHILQVLKRIVEAHGVN